VTDDDLTPREAADLIGITTGALRKAAAQRPELLAPREDWPDQRSARYRYAAVLAYAMARGR